MIGAIIGDIVGSPYEFNDIKTKQFPLFDMQSRYTDDSVMTVATADAILHNIPYDQAYRSWVKKYPNAGYGETFIQWGFGKIQGPYNSWGNGSAMRVSPIGFAFNTLEETLKEAKKSAEVTHNHPEGIKGAQATAAAIFLARNGSTKKEIKKYIEETFEYDLDRTVDLIRPGYAFDVSCQGSVPEAIICFLESDSYEDAIKTTVSLGGDCDTTSAICGGIAQAFYKEIPKEIINDGLKRIPQAMRDIVKEFNFKFNIN